MRSIWLLLVITMLGLHSPMVHAQVDPNVEAQAKALFDHGLVASDEERWADAAALFEQSRALLERPNTVFNLLGALYRLGRYDESLILVQRYLDISDPVLDGARRRETQALRTAMEKARANTAIAPGPAAGAHTPLAPAQRMVLEPPVASPASDVTWRGPTVPDAAPKPSQRRRRALSITGSLIVVGAVATTLWLTLPGDENTSNTCGSETTAGRCIAF